MLAYCVYCSEGVSNNWYEGGHFEGKCRKCNTIVELTHWVNINHHSPQGDERQVLIKRDNGRGGYWIDIAWWRPSANCFDDGLSVDFWCEIPQ